VKNEPPISIEDDFATQLKKLWNDTWSNCPEITVQKLLHALSANFGIMQMLVGQFRNGDQSEDTKNSASQAAFLLASQAYVLARFISEAEDDQL
jgi:hypothetical protein